MASADTAGEVSSSPFIAPNSDSPEEEKNESEANANANDKEADSAAADRLCPCSATRARSASEVASGGGRRLGNRTAALPPAGRAVELDSLELADAGAVEARWRMVGDIAVPWKPRLDLRGCTRYTLGGDGGRIVRYDESWAITPAEALLQLVRPR